MTKVISVVSVIVLLAVGAWAVGNCDGANNCYVSIIATGTGSGADWNNACTDFTGACDVTNVAMRGTTIWVGGSPGNYEGAPYQAKNFSAPDSGSLPITIIAATAENHGTDTGFRKQSATAIVLFTGPLNITTDFWVFNGQIRARTANSTESQGGGCYHDQYFGYHMQVNNATGNANGAIQISGNNVTLKYIYVQGAATSVVTAGGQYGQTVTDNGIFYSPGVTNQYLGYSWVGYTGADLVAASSGTNFTFEYNLFTKNHMGPAAAQSQAISIGDITGLTVRYNHFQDITSAAIITDVNADANPFTPNWYIYGNDIFWDTVVHTGTNYGLSSGILNLTGETLNGGVINVYNNTIAGINLAACNGTQPCNTTALNLNGQVAGSCAAHTQNCVGATAPTGTAYNNLWWDPFAAMDVFNSSSAQWGASGDYGEGLCHAAGCRNGGSFTVVGANDLSVLQPALTHNITSITRASNVVTATLDSISGVNSGNPISVSGVTDPSFNGAQFIVTATNAGLKTVTWNQTAANATSSGGTLTYSIVPFTSFNAITGNPNWYNFNFTLKADTPAGLTIPNWSTTPSGCTSGINCEDTDPNLTTRGSDGTVDRGAFQIGARTLLSVTMSNTGFGLNVGSTFPQVPVCTWSSAPTTDACPDGVAPYIKRWVSLDNTVATVSSSGVVTGVTPHNAFMRLYYGPLDSMNNTVAVVYDGLGNEPIATLPTGIVRTGSPLAFSGYDTTTFDANFPTTFSDPCPTGSGCTRWTPLTSAAFLSAIQNSVPGDTIVLQAGTSYNTNGVFLLPAKTNPQHKWIYIVSSNMSSLPPQGTRVSPNDAVNMPKVVENGGSGMIEPDVSSDHWWIAGLELIGAAQGTGHVNSGAMVTTNAPNPATATALMPDSITVDRCYMHTQGAIGSGSDMPHTTIMNASHWATLDSYIGPGLVFQAQAQAATNYFSPGPLKIVNNFFSAMGEDMILGGAGGFSNMWVNRDVFISHNIFWKDPAWRVTGFTIPPGAPYEVVDNFELKICQRCLIDGNQMQQSWASAQEGGAIVVNTGTGVNGPDAVLSDITFSNNIITGQLQGMGGTEFAANNNGCGADRAPCQYPGESRRVNYLNNLYVMGPQGPPGGRALIASNSVAARINRLETDELWQHNTFVGPYLTDHVYCDASFYFFLNPGDTPPTQNVWMLDNALCRQTQGFTALQGTAFLNAFMAVPSTPPVSTRYFGNLMQVFTAQGDKVQMWPTGNLATTSNFTYKSPTTGDYTVTSPLVTGSDGIQTGIQYSVIQAHQPPPLGSCSISGSYSGAIMSGVATSLTGQNTQTLYANPDGSYSFPNLAGGSYTVTPFQPGYTFAPVNIAITLTPPSCASTGNNFTATASQTFSISGTVSGAVAAGVTMKLTGAASGTTTTDGSGNYTFPGLGIGTYTVTPVLVGYSFTPTSTQVTITNANVTGINFTSTAVQSFSISGTVTLNGVGQSGVTMTLSGAGSGTTTTDSSGNYSFSGLSNGTYTITPSKSGFTYSPVNLTVTISGANVTGQNFTATAVTQTFSISGTVSGATAAGVMIALTGHSTGSTTTDSNGNYTFTGLSAGTYTLTPTKVGFTFSPTSITVQITNANITGQNFTASVAIQPTWYFPNYCNKLGANCAVPPR